MAKRRMISADVMEKDGFLRLDPACQAYYAHLHLMADDDGFVGNPQSLLRMYGFGDNVYDVLVKEGYLLSFGTGVCAIRHWPLYNHIKPECYTPTVHKTEFAALNTDKTEGYVPRDASALRPVQPAPQPAVHEQPPAPVPEEKPAAVPEDEFEDDFPFLWFPLADGGTFEITTEKLREYKEQYPWIDVPNELERMEQWLSQHPEKEITALYLERLVQKWLSNAEKDETAETVFFRGNDSYESPPSYDIDRAEYLMNTRVPKLKKKNR